MRGLGMDGPLKQRAKKPNKYKILKRKFVKYYAISLKITNIDKNNLGLDFRGKMD